MPRHSTSLTQEQDSMNIDRVQLDTTLAKIVDPHTGQNVLSAKNIRHLQVDGGRVLIDFTLPYPAQSEFDAWRAPVCSTPIFMARPSQRCWALPGRRNPKMGKQWNRCTHTAYRLTPSVF